MLLTAVLVEKPAAKASAHRKVSLLLFWLVTSCQTLSISNTWVPLNRLNLKSPTRTLFISCSKKRHCSVGLINVEYNTKWRISVESHGKSNQQTHCSNYCKCCFLRSQAVLWLLKTYLPQKIRGGMTLKFSNFRADDDFSKGYLAKSHSFKDVFWSLGQAKAVWRMFGVRSIVKENSALLCRLTLHSDLVKSLPAGMYLTRTTGCLWNVKMKISKF